MHDCFVEMVLGLLVAVSACIEVRGRWNGGAQLKLFNIDYAPGHGAYVLRYKRNIRPSFTLPERILVYICIYDDKHFIRCDSRRNS